MPKLKIDQLKKPENIKILVLIVILIIIGLLALKNLKSLWLKNLKLKSEVVRKTEELSRTTKTIQPKETVEAEIKKLEEKFLSFEKKFSFDTEEVFSSLNLFAEGSGISLKAINPADKLESTIPNTKDTYLELPVSLKVECGYYQLISFLRNIEGAQNLMLVSDIKIQSNPQNIWDHNIELSLKVPLSTLKKN